MNTVLHDLQAPGSSRTVKVFAYIDDILIVSSNEQEHLQDLDALFSRLSEYGLRVSPHECLFGQKQLEFLGHHLTQHGSTPLPEKVSAMKLYPRPRNAKELRRYLGDVAIAHSTFIPMWYHVRLYDLAIAHSTFTLMRFHVRSPQKLESIYTYMYTAYIMCASKQCTFLFCC